LLILRRAHLVLDDQGKDIGVVSFDMHLLGFVRVGSSILTSGVRKMKEVWIQVSQAMWLDG
jgi:hypothetical protein